jgi:hypothetical protein
MPGDVALATCALPVGMVLLTYLLTTHTFPQIPTMTDERRITKIEQLTIKSKEEIKVRYVCAFGPPEMLLERRYDVAFVSENGKFL